MSCKRCGVEIDTHYTVGLWRHGFYFGTVESLTAKQQLVLSFHPLDSFACS